MTILGVAVTILAYALTARVILELLLVLQYPEEHHPRGQLPRPPATTYLGTVVQTVVWPATIGIIVFVYALVGVCFAASVSVPTVVRDVSWVHGVSTRTDPDG